MVGKEKHIIWSISLIISSTKEQGGLSNKELSSSLKVVEATKAGKRKMRKKHSSGGRNSVKDGTRYYDREGYIPQ